MTEDPRLYLDVDDYRRWLEESPKDLELGDSEVVTVSVRLMNQLFDDIESLETTLLEQGELEE